MAYALSTSSHYGAGADALAKSGYGDYLLNLLAQAR